MENKIVVIYPAEKTIVLWRDVTVKDADLLEQIFAEFNCGSGQECSEFIDARVRSLSVNDFVGIEGNWYQCRSVGWESVTREFVNDTVEMTEEGINRLNSAWSSLSDLMWKSNYGTKKL
jgi:hypothetical protein